MGISGHSRALRAVILAVLALGMAWFGPATELSAGTLNAPAASDPVERSAEPFGLFASHLTGGGLLAKWQGVQRRLDDEMVQLALCEGDPDRCASPAALQFLAIVDIAKARDGRARLGEINRAINLAIRPMGDLEQHGQIDVWSSPLATLSRGAGDCEDYAIAKFIALQRAGVSSDDLRIVIMRDTIRGEDHAVAAAQAGWAMADAGQSPHGDGRGRPGQKLPAESLCSIATASDATKRRRCRCSGAQPGFASGRPFRQRNLADVTGPAARKRNPGSMQFETSFDIAVRPTRVAFRLAEIVAKRIFSFAASASTFD